MSVSNHSTLPTLSSLPLLWTVHCFGWLSPGIYLYLGFLHLNCYTCLLLIHAHVFCLASADLHSSFLQRKPPPYQVLFHPLATVITYQKFSLRIVHWDICLTSSVLTLTSPTLSLSSYMSCTALTYLSATPDSLIQYYSPSLDTLSYILLTFSILHHHIAWDVYFFLISSWYSSSASSLYEGEGRVWTVGDTRPPQLPPPNLEPTQDIMQ